MEKKLVTMNLAELLDISSRLWNLHDTMGLIAEAIDEALCGNVAMHMTDALGRISDDFVNLLDNAEVTAIMEERKEEVRT